MEVESGLINQAAAIATVVAVTKLQDFETGESFDIAVVETNNGRSWYPTHPHPTLQPGDQGIIITREKMVGKTIVNQAILVPLPPQS